MQGAGPNGEGFEESAAKLKQLLLGNAAAHLGASGGGATTAALPVTNNREVRRTV